MKSSSFSTQNACGHVFAAAPFILVQQQQQYQRHTHVHTVANRMVTSSAETGVCVPFYSCYAVRHALDAARSGRNPPRATRSAANTAASSAHVYR